MDSNKDFVRLLKKNRESLGIFDDEKNVEMLRSIKEIFVEKFLERGDVRFLILDAISEKPKHGYQIMVSVSKKFGGVYKPSPGSVYPTLQSLDDEGLVNAEEDERGKKVYGVTKKGVEYLKKNKKRLDEIHSQFDLRSLGNASRSSDRMAILIDLWTKLAYEVFLRSRDALRGEDPGFDKKAKQIEKILENTVKEIKHVWDA